MSIKLTFLLVQAIWANTVSETYKIYSGQFITSDREQSQAATLRGCVNDCLVNAPRCIGYSFDYDDRDCRLFTSNKTCLLPLEPKEGKKIRRIAMKTSSILNDCAFRTDLALGMDQKSLILINQKINTLIFTTWR